MEWLLALAIVTAIGIVLFAPINYKAKPRKAKKYRASGAVLFGINEIFQPSAANAASIQEEQKESRRAIPSPEDPLNPGG
jgi:accessory gene regulator protein AgrB